MFDYRKHFDWVSEHDAKARQWQESFHKQLEDLHQFHIPPGSSVLEWGCGTGNLLKALSPQRGMGLDVSEKMIGDATRLSSRCEFRQGDLEEAELEEKFDHLILCYLTGYLTDIQKALENLLSSASEGTRLYVSSLNTLWRPLLALGQKFGMVVKQPPSNWLSLNDLRNILELSGWEIVTTSTEQMIPFRVPLLTPLLNRFLVRLPFFRHLGATLFIVARPRLAPKLESEISCSVIVPTMNEAGNITSALRRIPVLGKKTEVIFVEGNSKDDTWEVLKRECGGYVGPHEVSYFRQKGKGKWDAVSTGFAKARGDVLVIQDGDLTAPPEDLPKFFDAVSSGEVEFANGSRLVYPMEDDAMQFLNFIGNKFFALALSFVLGQPIKDSLCGTKMLRRENYKLLLKRIKPFGEFDPFGDFNLLYGSALLDLKIRDIPVRYRERTYGSTNISRFRHGIMLLKMTMFGLRHLRFH